MSALNKRSKKFISRELSWIGFNSRVLDEAFFEPLPLLERLKFVAIFSSNLDEFFMVRMAELRQFAKLHDEPDFAQVRPSEQLKAIRRKLNVLLARQMAVLEEILSGLEKHQIKLVNFADLNTADQNKLHNRFQAQILPVLTPLAIDPSHPFPEVNNGAIEIAVSMKSGQKKSKLLYAFVEVPELLPRFVELDKSGESRRFIRMEQLIINYLPELFNGCEIKEVLLFRVMRDMDFAIGDEDGAEDLMREIEKKLMQRRHREPIRLEIGEYENGSKLAEWLTDEFKLDEQFIYRNVKMLHLKQLFELVGKVADPELLEKPWPPIQPEIFSRYNRIFEAVDAEGAILIAPPYQSFSPIVRMIEEAANDPDVLAIKQTLYRVSGNSPVVHALLNAAQKGKQVTVVVELKARFDEGNNIVWAKLLDEAGAHVIYGITNLKIHCKALLIVRRHEGMIKRYVHLGTGNYNDKTALLYGDCGMMSNDEILCREVAALFNVMTGYAAPPESWRKISAAPFNLREKVIFLIRRETELAKNGQKGRIIAKMNSLTDEEVINALLESAAAGVEIDLIIRGVCCLKLPEEHKNIRVISIVDRFLEHSRIFYFCNNGQSEYYLSSADWMVRNLSRRIELLFPVEDGRIRKVLMDMLQLQLHDDVKSRHMNMNGSYLRYGNFAESTGRSQKQTYEYFKKLDESARSSQLKMLDIHHGKN